SIRKDCGHQIVCQHALDLRRHLSTAAIARNGERHGCVPPPPRLEHRRVEKSLHEHVSSGGWMQVAKHVGQRKRMLRTERQKKCILGRSRLQLKIELTAEALAKREAPGAIHPTPKRRMQNELHAAGL